jgi:two-component system LytT family sensor kinase
MIVFGFMSFFFLGDRAAQNEQRANSTHLPSRNSPTCREGIEHPNGMKRWINGMKWMAKTESLCTLVHVLRRQAGQRMKHTIPATAMSKPVSGLSAQKTPYWVMISAFWVMITLATALHDWLTWHGDFMPALRFAASMWLPWAFLTPGIVWFSTTFPMERDCWRWRLVGHLGVFALITVLFGLISYWAGPPPFHPPFGISRVRPPQSRLPDGPPPEPPVGDIILRRAIFQFPIYWAIMGMAHAFVFYERARDRERHAVMLEAGLTKARLQTLQMQLQPHFLFNTLNSIASLIHENPRVADEMIGSMSDFLRLTLSTSNRPEVSLSEELVYLDHYLAIEKIRFGERLRVEKQIEPAALDSLVPVLILQPLLENAVKHGVEKQLAPVLVRISARRAGNNFLRLQVIDNGHGLNGAKEKLVEGVGLSNTRSRLQEVAGKASSLDFSLAPQGGLVVQIQIPWRTATEALNSQARPAS